MFSSCLSLKINDKFEIFGSILGITAIFHNLHENPYLWYLLMEGFVNPPLTILPESEA